MTPAPEQRTYFPSPDIWKNPMRFSFSSKISKLFPGKLMASSSSYKPSCLKTGKMLALREMMEPIITKS